MSAGITSLTKVDQTTLEVIKAREVESARILPNSPATPHGVIQGQEQNGRLQVKGLAFRCRWQTRSVSLTSSKMMELRHHLMTLAKGDKTNSFKFDKELRLPNRKCYLSISGYLKISLAKRKPLCSEYLHLNNLFPYHPTDSLDICSQSYPS